MSQSRDSFWDQEVAARKEAQGSPGCGPACGGAPRGASLRRAVEDSGCEKPLSSKVAAEGAGLTGHSALRSTVGRNYRDSFFPVQSLEQLLLPREKEKASRLPSGAPRSRLGRNWLGVDAGASLQPWPHAPAAQRLTSTVSSVLLSRAGTRLHPHFTEAAEEDQGALATCLRSRGRKPEELERRPRREGDGECVLRPRRF